MGFVKYTSEPGERERLEDAARTKTPSVTPSLPRLSHSFIWSLLGNIIYAGCQWGMLMILAKGGTPVMLGQFTLALAITTPMMLFAGLDVRNVQATDAKREYRFGDYMTLSLVTTTIAMLLIGLIAVWGGYRRETLLAILAMGFVKALEVFAFVAYGAMQQHERMDYVGCLQIIKGSLLLAAVFIGMYILHSVIWAVVGMGLVRAALLFACDLPLASRLDGKPAPLHWEPARLRALGSLALPLGIFTFVVALHTSVPRYYIEYWMGERELGIFAAIAYLMVAGTTISGAMSMAVTPRLAKYYANGDVRSFVRITVAVCVISALLGLSGFMAAAFAGEQILSLLYTHEYAAHSDVLMILMAAFTLQMVAGSLFTSIRAMRRFRMLSFLSLASIAILIALCAIWVRHWGIEGAAWAILANATFNLAAYGVATIFGVARPHLIRC